MVLRLVVDLRLSNNLNEICIVGTAVLKGCQTSGCEGNSRLVGGTHERIVGRTPSETLFCRISAKSVCFIDSVVDPVLVSVF